MDPLKTTIEPDRSSRGTGDLLIVTSQGLFQSHLIEKDNITIGRDATCDVVIDHRALSRRHAEVTIRPTLTVRDLDSTNGTHVAGGVLKGGPPSPLIIGESFHIGPFSFLVVASSKAGRSSGQLDPLRIEDPTTGALTPLVREIAASEVNVLIHGETGTGKEVLASSVHACSNRRGPFMRINCAALTETLLESELFGHEKGAFTGAVVARAGLLEAAAGGSVFLDEIGEMSLNIQAKLLRAVEAREILRLGSTRAVPIDVRFIAATHRDISSEIAAGRFRQDLFFRLDGVTLRIPPLRERRGAIAMLTMQFIEAAAERLGRPVRAAPSLFAALEAYDWPGNVRELKAVIERAVLLSRGGELTPTHLSFSKPVESAPVRHPTPVPIPPPSAPSSSGPEDLSWLTAEQRADRDQVVAALATCNGNQTRAAKHLGIARTTLVNKIALYRIPRPRS